MPQQYVHHTTAEIYKNTPLALFGAEVEPITRRSPLTLICWAARHYHHHDGRGREWATEFVLERLMDTGADCCKAVRSGARLTWDRTPRQPNRGEYESRAPVHRRPPALPWASWTFSRSATMSTAKCRRAVAPALQIAPSLLASVDSQDCPASEAPL